MKIINFEITRLSQKIPRPPTFSKFPAEKKSLVIEYYLGKKFLLEGKSSALSYFPILN